MICEAVDALASALDALAAGETRPGMWVYRPAPELPHGGLMAGESAMPVLRLMGAPLARVLRDWLCEAARREERRQLGAGDPGEPGAPLPPLRPGDEMHAALTVAAEILRVASDLAPHRGIGNDLRDGGHPHGA
jgi:hypothetical protein